MPKAKQKTDYSEGLAVSEVAHPQTPEGGMAHSLKSLKKTDENGKVPPLPKSELQRNGYMRN